MAKVDKFYAANKRMRDSRKQVLESAVEAYLRSTEFGSLYRRGMQLLILSGCKQFTSEVRSTIKGIPLRTTAEFVEGTGFEPCLHAHFSHVSTRAFGSFILSFHLS